MPILTKRRPTDLTQLYDAASGRWQATLDRLGYPAAYEELVQAGVPHLNSFGLSVLDAGTGTGALAKAFVQSGVPLRHIDLLDPSKDMLARAEAAVAHVPCPVRKIEGLIGTHRLDEQCYDVILCAHTIEHLDDPAPAFDWFRSHLVPGGRLLMAISRPHWCTALIRWQWGHKAYRPQAVQQMFGDAGLDQVAAVPFSKGPPSRTSYGYVATCKS